MEDSICKALPEQVSIDNDFFFYTNANARLVDQQNIAKAAAGFERICALAKPCPLTKRHNLIICYGEGHKGRNLSSLS